MKEFVYSFSRIAPKTERNAFRSAMAAGKCSWYHPSKGYIGSVDSFPTVIEKFTEFGLSVKTDGDVTEIIWSRIAEIHRDSRSITKLLDESSLFPYQKEGVSFITSRSATGVFDEMGLGKTVQTIMSIPTLPDASCVPTIVVSPASVKGTWKKEIKKWRPDITKVFILKGRDSFFIPHPGEVVIMNYDILPDEDDMDELSTAPDFPPGVCLIADELHAAKNPASTRTKRFRDLKDLVLSRAGMVIGLTGTPLLNKGQELREVCKSIGVFEEAFGTNQNFNACFYEVVDTGSPDYMNPRPELAERLAVVALRRHRKDVQKQLPPKIYADPIEADPPTGEAARICDEAFANPLVEEALITLEKSDKNKFGGMGSLTVARKALASCKIPKLLKVIEEEYEVNEEPVIVFSAHRAPIDVLAKRPGWVTITGSTSTEKRSQIESDFQAGKYKGIAGTIRAMSEGLTLTYAAHVLFVDRDWTPARNSQAEDRACRIGQNRGVIIRDFVADHPLDEKISECLAKKQEAFDKSVNKIPHFQTNTPGSYEKSERGLLRTAEKLQKVFELMTKAKTG